jgi:hypothetical protein
LKCLKQEVKAKDDVKSYQDRVVHESVTPVGSRRFNIRRLVAIKLLVRENEEN